MRAGLVRSDRVTRTQLENKAILVTGGSMGIGYACCEEIVRQGGRVLIVARGEKDLKQATENLNELRSNSAVGFRGDVSVDGDVRTAFEMSHEEVGPLDGIVHSAGVYGPIGSVTQVNPEEWLEAIRINLFGSFLVARSAAKYFKKMKRAGSLVLMSGGGAATPFPNYTAYACGKVGVVRLTESMALELAGSGIRVNCVAPGFVATRLHQQTLEAGAERAGTFVENTKAQLEKGGVPPMVAARAVGFLLSDRSRDISGRFLAAPYDDYEKWPERLVELAGSDLFTLRRIVPKDRGMSWQ